MAAIFCWGGAKTANRGQAMPLWVGRRPEVPHLPADRLNAEAAIHSGQVREYWPCAGGEGGKNGMGG